MTFLREVLLIVLAMATISSFMASIADAAQAPRDLTLGPSGATARTLGGVCYSMDPGHQALPCNPAFIAREGGDEFKAEFFLGNNIAYLNDVTDLLAGQGDEGSVRRLFAQSRGSELEAQFEADYRRPTWGFGLTPYRVVYYSFVRNHSLPVVTVLAAQEQTLRGQLGGYIGDDWSWGVQLRGVNRRLISQTFALTDVLVENGMDTLTPERQNAFYVEPGLLKEWTDEPWKPQFTMAITQLGYVDHKIEDFPASPELHVGGAVQAPIEIGRWALGADVALGSKTKTWSDPLRLGTSYEVGMTRLEASLGRSDQSFGFLLRYGWGTGGITYNSRYVENWLGDDEWVRTVAFQFGVQL